MEMIRNAETNRERLAIDTVSEWDAFLSLGPDLSDGEARFVAGAND
jgi:hypothetical protein